MSLMNLQPNTWYGWQMIPGYGDHVPYFSPIRVTRVTPKKTGRGILTVFFLNVLYAEGVQDFQLDLRILKHEEDYLIADLLYGGSGPTDRTGAISQIDFTWIRRLCPGVWSERPPGTASPAAQRNVSMYLDEVFPV